MESFFSLAVYLTDINSKVVYVNFGLFVTVLSIFTSHDISYSTPLK